MQRVTAERPEGRLSVVTSGQAGPPVLLLSGAGVDNAELEASDPGASHSHRVFALDWPKQGESRPWRANADHDCLMSCVSVVREHFGLAHPVHLVRLSQGGAIALAYAIAHPERVARLVAIAPGGILRFPPGYHQLLWLTARLPWLISGIATWASRSRRLTEAHGARHPHRTAGRL